MKSNEHCVFEAARTVWGCTLVMCGASLGYAQEIRITDPMIRTQTEEVRELMKQLPSNDTKPADSPQKLPVQPRLRIDKVQRLPPESQIITPTQPPRSGTVRSPGPVGQAYNYREDWTRSPKESDMSQVYVFLSLSAPDSVLRYHLKQAQQVGATVVLRGFLNNDAAQTSQIFINKFAMPALRIHIDPYKFRQWEVKKIPTWLFVKQQLCSTPKNLTDIRCKSEQAFKITGDVDWGYVADKVQYYSNEFDKYFEKSHVTP